MLLLLPLVVRPARRTNMPVNGTRTDILYHYILIRDGSSVSPQFPSVTNAACDGNSNVRHLASCWPPRTVEEGDNASFFCWGPRTGAGAENVSRPITGLQRAQQQSGVYRRIIDCYSGVRFCFAQIFEELTTPISSHGRISTETKWFWCEAVIFAPRKSSNVRAVFER